MDTVILTLARLVFVERLIEHFHHSGIFHILVDLVQVEHFARFLLLVQIVTRFQRDALLLLGALAFFGVVT